MKAKRLISLALAVLMSVGMLTGIVLPAHAANPVYIIDASGTDGTSGTLNGVSGTVYTTYAAFEAAFTSGGTADVYFAPGEYGAITVTKSVNLYGAKHGVNPNVKGSDILQPWTLHPGRGSGESTVTGKFNIKTTGAGNDVVVDGFTIDGAGYFQVDSSTQDLDITIRNIVVGKNGTRTDYFLNASPAVNTVPSAGAYYMDFTLQNVYADGYAGTGHFIYFIAARNTVLDGVFYANTTTNFLQTSAACRGIGRDNFTMKNSFLYNNVVAGSMATIYHRFPSTNMDEAVTYTNNVFFNAHNTTLGQSNSVSAHTIYCGEIKNKTQYYTFTGNTFVSEYGPKAALRLVATSNSGGDGYDCANMRVKGNRFIGYANSTSNWDGSYGTQIKTYNGKLDLSENFNVLIAMNSTADKVADYSTVAKCQALTGVAPKGINNGVVAKVDGPYWKDYDMTVASAAGTANIIDPDGEAGSYATLNGITGKVYNSYADFEAAYSGGTADVYFAPGEYGAITVTKSVNLYGAKHGINPNVKGSDILQPWTLHTNRGSGESVLAGKVQIAPTGKGNNVLVDGFTVDKAGQVWVNSSKEDLDVTVQNIVVGKNGTTTDYLFWASPTLNSYNIPGAGNYYMTFHLKNIYADGYKGTGRFIRMLAAKKMVLDNIYYANTTTHFLETTAASYIGDEYIMQNSFLYNNLSSSSDFTIYHRFPSVNKTQSVTYKDNVFYNAHRSTNGYSNSDTIMCGEIKNLTHYLTFTGNTFVTDYGARSPVRTATTSQSTGNGYDCSNIVFTENRVVGYYYTAINYDSNYGKSGYITQYNGAVDLSDNFTVRVSDQNQTADKVNDYSTVAKCQALTGVAPVSLNKGLTAKVDGPYYLNFDKTISTDMLRIADVNLSSASISDTTIRGICSTDYVPVFTYTCGNELARTMVIKNSAGTTVDVINAGGTYTVTVGYGQQTRDYTLIVELAIPYDGEGYLFLPDATDDTVARFWDGTSYAFTKGENFFTTLTDLFAKADADGVAVPKILLPAGEISGDYTINHSCQVLGYKHGINPIVRNPKPTEPDTLSASRGSEETALTGKWTVSYAANNMNVSFDGVTLSGDGRFADGTNNKTGEALTFKNIICSAGALSAGLGTNTRFYIVANSEKTLTYQNIWADGVKVQSANTTDYQLFYFNGTNTVVDNLYMANSDLALCGNVFYQSGKDYTMDLSFTLQNSKFYKDTHSTAYTWFATYYGSDTHDYYRYNQRQSVKTVLKNNLFYNCSKNSESNPAANALLNLRYPQPCFIYEITGNTFVEDREAYHFLTDEKKYATDVYSQFIHLYPMNNGIGGPATNVDLYNKCKVTGNRFIGRNTIINAELTYATTAPNVEDNFFIGYEAVQAMADVSDIYNAKGENPYDAVNVEFGEIENYYLDYDLTTAASTLAPKGEVAVTDHFVTLTKATGTLSAADFAQSGQTVTLYADAALSSEVTQINCATLKKGTHIYYMTVAKNGISETYTLALHTATTDRTYPDGKMYAPEVATLPQGAAFYRDMNGALYSFVLGETVFADMDDIVVHTQTTTPAVLLPAGNYTADELNVVESVKYVYDKNATYATPSVKKEKIKVLCVGDSITLGTGAGNRTLYAYPARLQELLGDDYEVINFGRGGSLGTDSSGYGYESTWNYSLSLEEAPDVVIMAFGANDAQNGYYGVPLDYFKQETMEMIERYQSLPSHPIVYMTTTTNIVDGWNQDWLTELRAIQRDTAATAGIGLIDGYNLSLTWGDSSAIYSDNCHFNATGYEKMAASYKGAVDWTEQGAHQPAAEEVSITFTAFVCAHEESDVIIDTAATPTTDGVGHTECTVCGETMRENITLPATGVALIGGQKYPSVAAAIAAAKTGDTIVLNDNATVTDVVLDPGVTLDLKGYTLTADYVIGFNTSNLINSADNADGKIVVAKDKLILSKDNRYLPIYDEANDCYFFTRVKNDRFALTTEGNRPKYSTSPMLKEYANNLLNTADKAENSGVDVIIRLTWTDSEGQYAGTQDYTYFDDSVARVMASYVNENGEVNYANQFYGIFVGSEIESGVNVTVSTIVRSSAGVEMESAKTALFTVA